MENPGKTELKRIRNCIKDYEYDENSLERGEFDYYKFNLNKRPDFSKDDIIKVTIEFSTGFDDKHTYEKDDYNNVIDNEKNKKKADQFIKKLKTDTSTKKGGQKKKQRKTRKTRKTRKNKQ
jgi:hypothetical protein